EIANITERRIERLVNPALNGDLPAFLSPEDGLQSGAMILQYSAAGLESENKTLAHLASVDSIPSSTNQEDHVSMGTVGARHEMESECIPISEDRTISSVYQSQQLIIL